MPRARTLPFVAKVAQRVVGEGLERLGDTALLLGDDRGELVVEPLVAERDPDAVTPDHAVLDQDLLAVDELVEQRRPRRVDEPDAGPHELERAGVREPPGHRRARR